ncbi:MAG TPA: GntR family transcriptional regulator [Candidatus Stackebrandtia faecavium]|nr:GntR family transcriptional regulator [Candidatus Stackebrandtia faecavium]
MFDDQSPIYRQIAHRIKDDILSGALAEDSQVMSTNQYAAAYRINPATAAKGLRELLDEEILYKRRGIGMFVSPDARAKLRQQHRDRFFIDFVEPMIAQAETLGISLDEVTEHIKQKKRV